MLKKKKSVHCLAYAQSGNDSKYYLQSTLQKVIFETVSHAPPDIDRDVLEKLFFAISRTKTNAKANNRTESMVIFFDEGGGCYFSESTRMVDMRRGQHDP